MLGQAVLGVLRCVDGHLLAPLKPRSGVSAWDAVVGRIPVLWTNKALRAGPEFNDHKKLLRWYGVLIRKKKLAAFASGAARGAEALDWLGWALPMYLSLL